VRLLVLGKAPPIQGGVSGQTFWFAWALAECGHSVELVTNAGEAEPTRSLLLYGDDERWLGGTTAGLQVHYTSPLNGQSYMPFAQPYSSKLIGVAHAVLERAPCDAILGWYLEPYGMAAAAIGCATGLPYVLRHAGSDIGRLAEHPDLRAAYRHAFAGAAAAIITNEREVERRLGVVDAPRIATRRPRLPKVFADAPQEFDVAALAAAGGAWLATAHLPPCLDRSGTLHGPQRPQLGVPVVGSYGKVGPAKGSFDLLAALSLLAEEGIPFAFLTLSCGSPEVLSAYYEAILSSPALAERTWALPPVAPWRVPSFLRACDVVCFLERGFPIAFHGPLVPREVLSSGTCLVCSAEIAGKPAYGGSIVDGRNAVVINDPRDHVGLARRLRALLAHPATAISIGGQGGLLSRFWEEELPTQRDAAAALMSKLEYRSARP
jgi:glycosyltransferase involved in cell wall biosynthesis